MPEAFVMPDQFRRNLMMTVLGAALPLQSRAGFDFFDNAYIASQPELQSMIARQFPRSQRYADLFRVTLSDPRVALLAQANRAAVTAHVSISSPLVAGGQIEGSVSLSSALRYDTAARALRLEQPRAERLELQGVSPGDAAQLRQIGGQVAQNVLQGQVLRTFSVEELTFGGRTYEIGDITVLPDGIKVELR